MEDRILCAMAADLGISKSEAAEAIRAAGLPENIRPEQLRLDDFAAVSEHLKEAAESCIKERPRLI